jgi:hypothetical protein
LSAFAGFKSWQRRLGEWNMDSVTAELTDSEVTFKLMTYKKVIQEWQMGRYETELLAKDLLSLTRK